MFRANHMDPATLQLSNLEQTPATEALQAGLLDVIVLASAPQSPLVQRLLRSPDIQLMDFGQSDAYSRRFAFLQPVTLPRGVVDLAADLPPQDVSMLAATTSLLAREQTHPALRQLFAQSAQTLHSGAGWFNRARDFPNTRTSELPVSPEGDRAINGTPPFWQRYLPFWASNLVERMWLVLGGLLVLMLPLSRVVPPLYQFRVRRRVFRWYARLREVESKLEAGTGEREALHQGARRPRPRGQQGGGAAVLCRRALCAAQQHLCGAQAGAGAHARPRPQADAASCCSRSSLPLVLSVST